MNLALVSRRLERTKYRRVCSSCEAENLLIMQICVKIHCALGGSEKVPCGLVPTTFCFHFFRAWNVQVEEHLATELSFPFFKTTKVRGMPLPSLLALIYQNCWGRCHPPHHFLGTYGFSHLFAESKEPQSACTDPCFTRPIASPTRFR